MVNLIFRLTLLVGVIVLCVLDIGAQVTKKDLSKKYKKLLEKSENLARAGAYKKATVVLDKVLKKYPEYEEAYVRKGSYLYKSGDLEASAMAFEKAQSLLPESSPMSYYSLAIVYRDLERYGDAVPLLEKYLRTTNKGRLVQRAENVLAYCKEAAYLVANPVPFDPVRLPPPINTDNLEYTPLPSVDGEEIVFTRRLNGQEDFYVAYKKDSTDYGVYPIEELNTPYNEGAHTLSADGRMMIYTACDYQGKNKGCDLYVTLKKKGKWAKPTQMNRAINSTSWDGQPSLSSDGKTLYFSSERPGGQGGRDIWYSKYHEEKGWSLARPLPSGINTPGHEESPFIHADGHTLYFRSSGLGGMGDYDIFYTRYLTDKKGWTKPKNIGYPINTKGDDGALSVSLDGKTAYFASDRDSRDTKTPNLDIYRFDLYKAARPQPMTFVKVDIIDAKEKTPIEAHVTMVDISKKDTLTSRELARGGIYTAPLPAHSRFAFFIEKPGYVYRSEFFDTDTVSTALEPYVLSVELEKIKPPVIKEEEKAKPLILKNIFFASGSTELKETSIHELHMLLNLARADAAITLTIVGHTDDVGSEADNQRLSEGRAQSVVNRLVEMGLAPHRLKAIGKGESEPIADNSTVEGRQQNRRTELLINREQ